MRSKIRFWKVKMKIHIAVEHYKRVLNFMEQSKLFFITLFKKLRLFSFPYFFNIDLKETSLIFRLYLVAID